MKKNIIFVLIFTLFLSGCYPGSTWNHGIFYDSIEEAMGKQINKEIKTIYLEDSVLCIFYNYDNYLRLSYLMMRNKKKVHFSY